MYNLSFILLISGLFLIGYGNETGAVSDTIPYHLWDCYRNKVPLLPMTLTSLIEILQKIELQFDSFMNMRILSNAILHRFWRDGIERDPAVLNDSPDLLPFRTTGSQSYKYKILINKLIPGSGSLFPNGSLTLSEQCTLHFMLSSTVDIWERGDESTVCPKFTSEEIESDFFIGTGSMWSSCPIEKGVISVGSNIDTVSPSHIIAAVATALAPMNVKQKYIFKEGHTPKKSEEMKEVSNLWASTLAGDLAEVIVMQVPLTRDVFMGLKGKWNDSIIPVNYYMLADVDVVNYRLWQCTNAEILGSIDGLVMAEEAQQWVHLSNSLRLSQLLEMYYKNRGGTFPKQSRACNRQNYYKNRLLFEKRTILQQTQFFGEVLADYAPHNFLNDSFIEANSELVWDAFTKHTSVILSKQENCPPINAVQSKIRLNVIFDSTWNPYERQRFMLGLSDDIDVSIFGSTITIISGKYGEIVVNNASTVGEVYLQWINATGTAKDPVDLTLSTSLLSVNSVVHNITNQTGTPHIVGHVTLVLGLSAVLTNDDIEHSKSVISSIRSQIPDMKFVYLCTNANTPSYVRLTAVPGSQNDEILTVPNHDPIAARKKVVNYLNYVPKSIRPSSCLTEYRKPINSTYEEYINPGVPNYYEIHPKYLCHSTNNVALRFKNRRYGTLEVCLSREGYADKTSQTCKAISLDEEVEFYINSFCQYNSEYDKKQQWDPDCKPVYLTVFGKKSFSKCSEKECYLPDQIRFSIQVQGLICIRSDQVICSLANQSVLSIILLYTVTLYVLYYNKE